MQTQRRTLQAEATRRPPSAGVGGSLRTKDEPSRATARGLAPQATLRAPVGAGETKQREKNGISTGTAPQPARVSSISQYLDVFNAKCPPEFIPADTWALPSSSQTWLAKHGLAAAGLAEAELERMPSTALPCFLQTLQAVVEMYQKRLEYLNSDSMQAFGFAGGPSVTLAVDIAHPYLPNLVSALHSLVEQQVRHCKRLGLISFGEKLDASFGCIDINVDALERVTNWIDHLRPAELPAARRSRPAAVAAASGATRATHTSSIIAAQGEVAQSEAGPATAFGEGVGAGTGVSGRGPNLLQVFDAVVKLDAVGEAFVVLHRRPAHDFHTIAALLREKLAGKTLVVNVITFWNRDPALIAYARDLALLGRGRCHVFDGESAFARTIDGHSVAGDDVALVQAELQHAEAALALLQRRAGEEDTRPAPARNPNNALGATGKPTRAQILRELARGDSVSKKVHRHEESIKEYTRLVDRPLATAAAHDPPTQRLSSPQWLARHGLALQKLEVYDVLAPVAYSCSRPGLYLGEKYKSMTKVAWRDGTEKTVHLDPAMLVLYRKRLLALFHTLNDRMRWLGTGSRRLFGNLSEDVLTLAIDISRPQTRQLALVREHLRRLFAEQLPHARWVNALVFDSEVVRWQLDPQPVGPASMQALWAWFDTQLATPRRQSSRLARISSDGEESLGSAQTAGDRNVLGCLKTACDDLRPQARGRHGIYLLCGGRASQPTDAVVSYVREILLDGQTAIHTCAYNCMDDSEAVAMLQAVAAHSGGRFSLCIEDEAGVAMDGLHDDSVSWAVVDEAQLQEALAATLAALRDPPKLALTPRSSNMLRAGAEQPSTYHLLADWAFARKSTLATEQVRVALNFCDGDDLFQLRRELELGHRHLKILDDILRAMPPEYTQAALSLAREQQVPFARPRTPATLEEDVEDGSGAGLDGGQAGGPTLLATTLKAAVSFAPTAASAAPPPKSTRATRPASATATLRASSRHASGTRTASTPAAPAQNPGAAVPREPSVETQTTREWLREHGLGRQGLRLDQFIRANCVPHRTETVAITGGTVAARHCDVLHVSIPSSTFNEKSDAPEQLYHVTFAAGEWCAYQDRVRAALRALELRMKWLTSGSRRLFGNVLEENVCIAIDSSGSMNVHMPFVQAQVELLLDEQVRRHCRLFSLLHFNSSIVPWTDVLITANDDTTLAARPWINAIAAGGGTRLLPVFEHLQGLDDLQAVYLLSDGAPDESKAELLQLVKERFAGRIKFHTISFDCRNDGTNQFLKDLAHTTSGRFLAYSLPEDCTDSSQGATVGDDVARLQREIDHAHWCLDRAGELHQQAVDWAQARMTARAESLRQSAPTPVDRKPRWGENNTSRRRGSSSSSAASVPHAGSSTAASAAPAPVTARQTKASQLRAQRTADTFSSFTSLTGHRYMLNSDDGSLADGEENNGPASDGEMDDDSVLASTEQPSRQTDRKLHGYVMTATGLVASAKPSARPTSAPVRKLFPHSVLVRNIPPTCQPQHLEQLFQRLGLQVAGVRIPWDHVRGALVGHAYVGFATAADARRALAVNGAVMGDGNLHVSLAADSAAPPVTRADGLAGLVAVGNRL